MVRPTGRAGHSSLFELSSSRKRVWLFGGYTTYYPYLRTDATGAGRYSSFFSVSTDTRVPHGYSLLHPSSHNVCCADDHHHRDVFAGPGTQSSTGGFIPYPGYDYFRNDLWYFDLDTNLWVEVMPPDCHCLLPLHYQPE